MVVHGLLKRPSQDHVRHVLENWSVEPHSDNAHVAARCCGVLKQRKQCGSEYEWGEVARGRSTSNLFLEMSNPLYTYLVLKLTEMP